MNKEKSDSTILDIIIELIYKFLIRGVCEMDTKGVNFLIAREGMVLHCYDDAVGSAKIKSGRYKFKGYKTIGIGTEARAYRKYTGKDLKWDTVITKEEAIRLFNRYMQEAIYPEMKRLRIKEQVRFNVLCSFFYNLGIGISNEMVDGKYQLHKAPTSSIKVLQIKSAPTQTIKEMILHRKWSNLANAITWYRNAGGRINVGLVKRRDLEAKGIIA